jgi:hypothetical protein
LQQPAGRQQVSGRRAQAGQASALVWRGPRAPFSLRPCSCPGRATRTTFLFRAAP